MMNALQLAKEVRLMLRMQQEYFRAAYIAKKHPHLPELNTKSQALLKESIAQETKVNDACLDIYQNYNQTKLF